MNSLLKFEHERTEFENRYEEPHRFDVLDSQYIPSTRVRCSLLHLIRSDPTEIRMIFAKVSLTLLGILYIANGSRLFTRFIHKYIAPTLIGGSLLTIPFTSQATNDFGANDTSNTKIRRGGASTLQKGISKTITRGVNLDNSDFSNQDLSGVAFQQSIVRDTNFENSKLRGASFFDATLDGSNFENADLTLANVELAQFTRANFKNTIAREMYVVGGTNFKGIATIENR